MFRLERVVIRQFLETTYVYRVTVHILGSQNLTRMSLNYYLYIIRLKIQKNKTDIVYYYLFHLLNNLSSNKEQI